MEMDTTMETPAIIETREFTLNDRCDACSAAAKVEWQKAGFTSLLMCGHHSRGHEAKLMDTGWKMIPEAAPAPDPVNLED